MNCVAHKSFINVYKYTGIAYSRKQKMYQNKYPLGNDVKKRFDMIINIKTQL